MIGGDVLAGLGVLAALFLAVLGYGRRQRVAGRKETEAKAKEIDNAKADTIRDRVERDLPERVRRFDGAGYRD